MAEGCFAAHGDAVVCAISEHVTGGTSGKGLTVRSIGGATVTISAMCALPGDRERLRADGEGRRLVFRASRAWSANMLAIVAGRLVHLAGAPQSTRTPSGLAVAAAVWGLPGVGAGEAVAAVPLRVLAAAVPAWEAELSAPLPGLGKLDMVVWNGAPLLASSLPRLLATSRPRFLASSRP